ncbi:MAG: glycosyltransferase, partial [Candidatus Hydrogenedentes bacterium]|nr:glycosyltransferase [Candidatus Hydrogenedentota bacterium]
LQVSRMEPWKGHRNLLRALARMRTSVDWRCLLVGGAQKPDEVSYERELLAMVQELGLAGRVIFAGQRHDVARVLRAADVFCQANEAPEPFGVVFVEALFAGLPVVTSAFGGGAEIVDDTVGFLVAPGDLARLAEALGRLVEDPALRTRLGCRGPARADTLCNPGRQLGSFRNLVVRSAEGTSRLDASGDARSVHPGIT